MEAPRWKTVRVTHRMGIPYEAGVPIKVDGWPSRDVEPENDAARRIKAWPLRSHPLAPSHPFNALLGCVYLPGVLPDFGPQAILVHGFDEPRHSTISPVPAAEVLEGMPRYTCAQDLQLSKAAVPAGQEFAFLGWPLSCFEAANEPASAVLEYFEENEGHPELLPSPWCCHAEDIVLPKLPRVKMQDDEAADQKGIVKGLRAMGYAVKAVG